MDNYPQQDEEEDKEKPETTPMPENDRFEARRRAFKSIVDAFKRKKAASEISTSTSS